MITSKIKCCNLERGDLVIIQTKTYRVIINSYDDLLMEQLEPVHAFIWWDITKIRNETIEKIKSSN